MKDVFVQETNIVPAVDEATGIRVDFIFSFIEYERAALGRTLSVSMEKIMVRFAWVEDPIIHKLFSGRPRDTEDVRSILVRKPVLDETYLRFWLHELSTALHRNLPAEFEGLSG